jgi:multiple antibiotic resistance protein
MYLELYKDIFFKFFIIIDPIGYTLIFLSVTKDLDKEIKNKIAWRAICIGFFIQIFYLLTGKYLLEFIGINSSAMKIIGGLSLLKTSYMIIYQIDADYNEVTNENSLKLAISPLATVILAGPGTLTTLIIESQKVEDLLEYLIIIFSLFSVLMICLIGSLFTNYISKINKDIIHIITIMIGVLLASLSITFIINGLNEFKYNDII